MSTPNPEVPDSLLDDCDKHEVLQIIEAMEAYHEGGLPAMEPKIRGMSDSALEKFKDAVTTVYKQTEARHV